MLVDKGVEGEGESSINKMNCGIRQSSKFVKEHWERPILLSRYL